MTGFESKRQAAQQQAEPVALAHSRHAKLMAKFTENAEAMKALAQAEPPQRQWVGLTDEDCKRMSAGDKLVAMWAERILKEKNND